MRFKILKSNTPQQWKQSSERHLGILSVLRRTSATTPPHAPVRSLMTGFLWSLLSTRRPTVFLICLSGTKIHSVHKRAVFNRSGGRGAGREGVKHIFTDLQPSKDVEKRGWKIEGEEGGGGFNWRTCQKVLLGLNPHDSCDGISVSGCASFPFNSPVHLSSALCVPMPYHDAKYPTYRNRDQAIPHVSFLISFKC